MLQAFEGIEVLDFTNLLPGPFCTLELVRRGARVIKVENTRGGDPLRWMPPRCGSDNAFFLFLNRGKESIQLDLKSDAGRQVAQRLVARCDVLVESFRPGAMARLGLDYERASALNPRLVYASLSAYGAGSAQPGHDLNFVSRAGLLGLFRRQSLHPPPLQLGDVLGGLDAAWQIALGLLRRERTGQGSFLDVCMTDSVFNVVSPTVMEYLASRREGSGFGPTRALTGLYPCYNVYATKDEKWVALGALEPQFWAAFCRHFDVAELIPQQFDPSPQTRRRVQEVFQGRTFAELEEICRETDFCLTPVYEMDDLMDSDYLAPRLRPVEGDLLAPGPPDERLGPVPGLGQHTESVLRQLGYSEEAVSEMRRLGAVG